MADSPYLGAGDRIYHIEVDVEDLEGYRLGGYHSTLIGDTFCEGRYEVVHRLGAGGYSTTWLARDWQLQRYVPLKILVAVASRSSNETRIFRLLTTGEPNRSRKQFIPTLLDRFSFEGPNGHHLCLVGEPAGCSIACSKDYSSMLPPAQSIAAQLIMSLDYLHANDECHEGVFKKVLSFSCADSSR